jgi:hypothetical protein
MRRNAQLLLDGGRVINFATIDHCRDLVDIVNVLGRITVDEHHVGEFAGRITPPSLLTP